MILVTGGTGFLGAYIIKHLVEKGHNVRAIRRTNSIMPAFVPPEILKKVEWVNGDVLDIVSLEEVTTGIDTIIHSAAKVSFASHEKEEMLKINIEGTANVVNIAIEKNIRRFIHISSVAALGRTVSGETVTEEKKWQDNNTNTNYAISKHKAEMEVWRGFGEGLRGIIINPSTILGYGDWNNSSCAIFKTVYRKFPFYTTGINGFVFIEDVAKATVQLLETDISHERFIINGDNWSFQQLFNTIADAFETKRPGIHVTPSLSAIAWRWEKMKSLFTGHRSLLSKESARIAQTRTFFDNGKLCKHLPGFIFTPLETAIKQSCALYIKNLPQGHAR